MKFNNSKVSSHTIGTGKLGKLHTSGFGKNTNTHNVSLKSGTKSASNPTC